MWKGFSKFLDIAGVTIKDPFVNNSCNIPPKKVWVSIKNVYTPVFATLWTAYTKPEGTHDKLRVRYPTNIFNLNYGNNIAFLKK